MLIVFYYKLNAPNSKGKSNIFSKLARDLEVDSGLFPFAKVAVGNKTAKLTTPNRNREPREDKRHARYCNIHERQD